QPAGAGARHRRRPAAAPGRGGAGAAQRRRGRGGPMSLADYWDLFGSEILRLVWRHLLLVAISVAAATVIGVLAGVAVAKDRRFGFLFPLTNSLHAAPELALLAIAIPFLRLRFRLALHAAVL